jgi:tetratricopeptide (TPR) repeat protein
MQRGQGNNAAALETIRTGAATTDVPDLHFAYIDNLVAEKRYKDAQDYLTKLIENKKDLAIPGYIRLAAMNAEQRKFREARQFYESALKINPDYYQAAEGYVLMEVASGRTPQALAWAQNRTKERPEDPSSMALLAEVYNESKRYNDAIEAFKNAARIAPQWDQPYVRIMQIYNAQLNKPEEAVKYLKESWDDNPTVFTPAVILAAYYESVKQYVEAEALYREVLAKNPDIIAVNNNLAYTITLHDATPERLEEAREMAYKAAASNTPETLDTLGWVYYKLNKLPEALETINKAYEAGGSNSPVISYHLAIVHDAMGNKEEAKKILAELLDKFEDFEGKEEAAALLKQL